MSGGQLAERRARSHQLPRPHRRHDRLVARPQPARVGHRDQRPDRPAPRRTPPSPARRHTPADRALRPGQRRDGRVASSATARRTPAKPLVAAATASSACRHRPARAPRTPPRRPPSPPPRAYAQLSASPPGCGSVHLGMLYLGIRSPPCGQSTCWHACKLKSAIRVSGLTSRACAAAPFFQGCIRMPGGPESENSDRVRHAADARAWHHPTPGDNRQLKDMADNGCCNHEAAA